MQWAIEDGKKKRPPRPPTADQLAVMAAEPMLDYGTAIILRAYGELSTCRPGGMSMLPIPWTAMLAWVEHHELENDVANHLIRVLRIVDSMVLRKAHQVKS